MDYQDKYETLQEQHRELKVRSNEQGRELRKINVQLIKTENALKARERLDASTSAAAQRPGSATTGGAMALAQAEKDRLIKRVYAEKSELERRNAELTKANRSLAGALDKKKRELAVAKRGGGGRPGSASARTAPGHAAALASYEDGDTPLGASAKVGALVATLKKRLDAADRQVRQLREERDEAVRGGGGSAAHQAASAAARVAAGAAGGGGDEQQGRDLRDTRAKLQLMSSRYEQLEAKANAQTGMQQGTLDQLDDYNRRVRELRRKLQEVAEEKDAAVRQAERLGDVEESLKEAEAQNKRLEDQIKDMAQSPFIENAYAEHSKVQKAVELEKQNKGMKLKLEHLKEVAQTHHSALNALKKQAEQLREEKDAAQAQLLDVKLRHREVEAGQDVLKAQQHLYMGGASDVDGVQLEELERALTIVKRRAAQPASADFLEDATDGGAALDAADGPTLRRRLVALQEAHLQTTFELERAEKMYRVQLAVNGDLQSELEEMSKRLSDDKRKLYDRVQQLEAEELESARRVQSLEAQLKQKLYAAAGGNGGGALGETGAYLDGGASVAETEGHEALLEEIGGELAPDENLVEVWIVDAALNDKLVQPGVSTFFIVDFFNYESQATQLLPGPSPNFDFATSYKVSMDDFFLRYLASERLTLELSEAQQADFELLAKCELPLHQLLEGKPVIKLLAEPLRSVHDGTVVGTVHVQIRMAVPVVELFEGFKKRHPDEWRTLSRRMLATIKGEPMPPALAAVAGPGALADALANASEGPAPTNELEVVIHSASGLPTRYDSRKAPSPYVNFQLLQFADNFTPIVRDNTDPVFEHAVSFPLEMTSQVASLLKHEHLLFTVLDFASGDGDDGGDGDAAARDDVLIGSAEVNLEPLALGDAVYATLPVQNDLGRAVAEVRVAVRWKRPFRVPETSGPNALSAPEVEMVLSRYSPQKDGQIEYRLFAAEADPPPAAAAARDALHHYAGQRRLADDLEPASLYAHLLPMGDLNEDEFVRAMLQLKVGVPADDLAAFFDHCDAGRAGRVGAQALVAHLTPATNALTLLLEKVRRRAVALRHSGARGLGAVCEDLDAEHTGRLTRGQFKQALAAAGFQLLDDAHARAAAAAAGSSAHHPPALDVRGGEGGGGRGAPTTLDEEIIAPASPDALEADNRDWEEQKKKLRDEVSQARAEMAGQQAAEEALSADHAAAAAAAAPNNAGTSAPVPTVAPLDVEFPQAAHEATVEAPTRELLPSAAAAAPSTPGAGPSALGVVAPAAAATRKAAPLVEVEKKLHAACRRVEGLRGRPDIRAAFEKVAPGPDAAHVGTVNRQQFCHALNTHPDLNLAFEDLYSLMEYFADERDPARVCHTGFCVWFEQLFTPFAVSPGVRACRQMLLHSGSALAFDEADARGDGVVTRAAFADALRSLNFTLSDDEVYEVARLFELRPGAVHYRAFLGYAVEGDRSSALRAAENKARTLLKRHGKGRDLRAVFAKYDAEARGVITQREFARALADVDCRLSEAELRHLFDRIDPADAGIKYMAFSAFIHAAPEPVPPAPDLADEATDRELQRKCYLCVAEAVGRLPAYEGEMLGQFVHYDWRRKGHVAESEFASAVVKCGFPLRRCEARALADKFGDGARVRYERFLEWAADDVPLPGLPGGAARLAADHGGGVGGAGLDRIIDELRRAVQTAQAGGRSMYQVFDMFDSDYSGTVDETEFRTGMRQLGVAVTAAEARGLAQHFGGGTLRGGRVRYRDFLRAVAPSAPAERERAGALAATVRAAISRASGAAGSDWWRAFEQLDRGQRGALSRDDFRRGLSDIGVRLAPEELRALLDIFDRDRDGTISYREFVQFCQGEAPSGLDGGGGGGAAAPEAGAEEAASGVKRVREAINRAVRRGLDYRALFDRAAEDDASGSGGGGGGGGAHSGEMSRTAFRAALRALDVDASAGEEAALERRFGAAAETVLYLEVLHAANKSVGDAWRLSERLRSMIRKKFKADAPGKLRRAFKHFDTKRRGKFTETELSDGLRALRLHASAEQEHGVFEAMDVDRDGRVAYAEFVVWVKDPNHADVAQKARRGLQPMASAAVRGALESYDTNGSGLVGAARDFSRALEMDLGLDLTESEVARLARRFDAAEDGNVNIDAFVAFADGAAEGEAAENSASRRKGGGAGGAATQGRAALDGPAKEIVEELRDAAARHARAGKEPSVGAAFGRLDRDGEGTVDEADFVDCLRAVFKAARLGRDDEKDLAAAYEGRRRGAVRVNAFLSDIGAGEGGGAGGDADAELAETLKAEFRRVRLAGGRSRPESVADVFEELDRGGAGYVSKAGLGRGLARLGVELLQTEVSALATKFAESASEKGRERIKYKALGAWLKDEGIVGGGGGSGGRDSGDEGGTDAGAPAAAALRKALRREDVTEAECKAAFRKYEVDGAMEPSDLPKALQRLHVADEVSSKDVKALCLAHEDAEGLVKTHRLLKALYGGGGDADGGGGAAKPDSKAVRDAKRAVADARATEADVRSACERGDADGAGELDSASDLVRALRRAGVDDVEKRTARALCDAFPGTDEGTCAWKPLLKALFASGSGGGGASPSPADACVAAVGAAVREAGGADKAEVRSAFKRYDPERTGDVDADAVPRAVRRLPGGDAVEVTRADGKALADAYPGGRRGTVDYASLGAAIVAAASKRASSSSRKTAGDDSGDDSDAPKRSVRRSRDGGAYGEKVAASLRKLRQAIAAVSEESGKTPSLKRAFREFDLNGSGRVSRREMRTVLLDDLRLDVSRADVDAILDYFDEDGDGKITYAEFAAAAEKLDAEEGRVDSAFSELKRLVAKAARRGADVGEAFSHFDVDGSGDIDEDEFAAGLKRLLDADFQALSRDELRRLMARFKSRKYGRIKYKDFVREMRPAAREEARRSGERDRDRDRDRGRDSEDDDREDDREERRRRRRREERGSPRRRY